MDMDNSVRIDCGSRGGGGGGMGGGEQRGKYWDNCDRIPIKTLKKKRREFFNLLKALKSYKLLP